MNQRRRQRDQQERGFTLIELMIVVVILGIISMITVTAVLRQVSRTRNATKAAQRAVKQKALEMRQLTRTEKGWRMAKGKLPSSVVSSSVKVALKVDYVLEKGRVIPVYDARFKGDYILANPTQKTLYALVLFPFPRGAGTFSNLKFEAQPQRGTKGPTSRSSQPRGKLRMSPQGMTWQYQFAPGQQVKIGIRYDVRGRDRYHYNIAPGKKRKFHFVMDITGVDPTLPAKALQPNRTKRSLDPTTQKLTSRYEWRFRDFLSTEPIEVRFPARFSKYHKFGLLGKWGFVALLFFGLFFWLLGEQFHPGKIQSGGKSQINFGLLFLGFVVFFPLFIFLEEHVALMRAFGVGLAAASLLTTGHVITFMGWRWAFGVSLPLQLFFTTGFTFAIMVPTYRPLSLTIGAIILVAFMIIARAHHQKRREQEEAEAERRRKKRQEEEELTRKEHAQRLQAAYSFEEKQEPIAQETAPIHKHTEPAQEAKRHCLFCRAEVGASFMHCHECGERLERTYSCGGCNEEYWYPSVESFSYCRQCGDHLSPPPSPLNAHRALGKNP